MRESDEIVVLEARASSRRQLRDLWAYRELFYFLAWRDVLVRYKQTVFGVAWALARPVATMAVFAFVFGRVAGLSSEGVPYPLYVLAGTLPWQLFASGVGDAGGSMVANAHIVSKVYFPRLVVPASSLVVALIDFAVSFAFLLGLCAWYGQALSLRLTLVPLFVGLALAVSFGAALWLAALNVRYRDVRYVVPFLVQFGLFVSPVGYGSAVVPASVRTLYSYNPMVAPIDGMRWALFGTAPAGFTHSLGVSVATAVLLLVSGYAYFRRTESTFADVI